MIIPFHKITLSSNVPIYHRLPYGEKPVNEQWGKFTEYNNNFQFYIDEQGGMWYNVCSKAVGMYDLEYCAPKLHMI